MGFKLVKFRAILHVAEDIRMFGVPMNVDTGSNESHHKLTKVAAKLTQKDPATFEEQTCHRLDDLHVLEMALQELEGRKLWLYENGDRDKGNLQMGGEEEELHDPPTNHYTGGTKFEVYSQDTVGQVAPNLVMVLLGGKHLPGCPPVEADLLRFLHAVDGVLGQFTDDGKLIVHSEHIRDGIMFRSHRYYRWKGPWRDWVMVHWGGGHQDLPSKIWGYIILSKLHHPRRMKLPCHLWGGTRVTIILFSEC